MFLRRSIWVSSISIMLLISGRISIFDFTNQTFLVSTSCATRFISSSRKFGPFILSDLNTCTLGRATNVQPPGTSVEELLAENDNNRVIDFYGTKWELWEYSQPQSHYHEEESSFSIWSLQHFDQENSQRDVHSTSTNLTAEAFQVWHNQNFAHSSQFGGSGNGQSGGS